MTIQQKILKIQALVNETKDGIWGKKTARAVATRLNLSFNPLITLYRLNVLIQKKVNTPADGIVGHATCDSILEYLGEPVIVTNDGFPTSHCYTEIYKQTPNISLASITPIGVVLHHSCGSFLGSVDWCLRSMSKVSYHCIINLDGSRVQLAKDNQRAWHAGKSSFKGKSDCNGFMLGLAFSGDTNIRELTNDEINSAVEWILERIQKFNWPKDLSTITTHRAVSPGRKDDVDKRAEKVIIDALKKRLQ